MPKRRNYKDSEESSDDINFYAEDVRQSMLEDDELSPFEEAFMKGYEEAV